ncbi:hypothetical protein [Paraclostridium sordellii]|nr:hypothetical protein [Paeniclostridium sordellii]AUO31675.1 hypothetical protein [Paeniclostridium sordellii]AUO31769.1 hypothetical protein [Paeniclostridium sordellii]EPZ56219.1 hypothetical protein H476_2821 [[Clostridium] sordellii VPI 9048] [Paeniclostridium sordellii VPI 9048]CEK40116.1 hypothetical protein JGS6382_PCS1300751 (plasmid) [[Clostridium] sordellii] [Paeniclostridium sordellii]
MYIIFIECEFISDKISLGLETSDVSYISEEEFENLNISLVRNSIDDLKVLYNYYKNPSEKTLFD